MDKKEAEMEALRKAKETQHAAGKNTGMSGKDLVWFIYFSGFRILNGSTSLNITPSGLKTRMRATRRTIGTLRNTGSRKRMKTLPQRRRGSRT